MSALKVNLITIVLFFLIFITLLVLIRYILSSLLALNQEGKTFNILKKETLAIIKF